MKKLLLCLIALTTFVANSVNAETDNRGDARERIEPNGFLYGFGLGINQEIYQGYDYRVIPLPIIGYRSEKLSILGPFVSYELAQFNDVEFTVQAAPRFQGFDESDSAVFENMADRRFSMDAGLGIQYEKRDWKVSVKSMFDVLNRSGGYELTADLGRVFRYGPVFVEPSISLSYLDDKHVDYYYGVKANETNELTYQYQGKSAVNTRIGFSVATPIFFSGFTMFAIDYTRYDDVIADSPLVDQNHNISARLMFSKFF
ncbi:MipA/OmpV family protein [Thalassotalea sp. PLHSN55]|uniref:MipA/OmpV family protein n=1 Tax=Thalassotalea sp. PLHSN55 TaxID=3435888 RepID=UPI003F851528